MELRELKDLKDFVATTLERVGEMEREKAVRFLEERIEKLEDWWYGLPEIMKNYFKAEYERGLKLLLDALKLYK